jgi:uncharacterized membrane protein
VIAVTMRVYLAVLLFVMSRNIPEYQRQKPKNMSFKSEEIMKLLKERIAKDGKDYVKKVKGTYLFAVKKVRFS